MSIIGGVILIAFVLAPLWLSPIFYYCISIWASGQMRGFLMFLGLVIIPAISAVAATILGYPFLGLLFLVPFALVFTIWMGFLTMAKYAPNFSLY